MDLLLEDWCLPPPNDGTCRHAPRRRKARTALHNKIAHFMRSLHDRRDECLKQSVCQTHDDEYVAFLLLLMRNKGLLAIAMDHCEDIKELMVQQGTRLLLNNIPAGFWAGAILLLECLEDASFYSHDSSFDANLQAKTNKIQKALFEDQGSFYSIFWNEESQVLMGHVENEKVWQCMLDLWNLSHSNKRAVTLFFDKRAPCSCLCQQAQDVALCVAPGYCAYCHKEKLVQELGICAHCHFPGYCSRQCQCADWKNHKSFCKTIVQKEFAKTLTNTHRHIIVDNAGIGVFNGVHYHDGYFDNACKFIRRFSSNTSEDYLLYIFQSNLCNLSNHWYIIMMPLDDQAGTRSGETVYSAPVTDESLTIPPFRGWKAVHQMFDPAPKLRYDQSLSVHEQAEHRARAQFEHKHAVRQVKQKAREQAKQKKDEAKRRTEIEKRVRQALTEREERKARIEARGAQEQAEREQCKAQKQAECENHDVYGDMPDLVPVWDPPPFGVWMWEPNWVEYKGDVDLGISATPLVTLQYSWRDHTDVFTVERGHFPIGSVLLSGNQQDGMVWVKIPVPLQQEFIKGLSPMVFEALSKASAEKHVWSIHCVSHNAPGSLRAFTGHHTYYLPGTVGDVVHDGRGAFYGLETTKTSHAQAPWHLKHYTHQNPDGVLVTSSTIPYRARIMRHGNGGVWIHVLEGVSDEDAAGVVMTHTKMDQSNAALSPGLWFFSPETAKCVLINLPLMTKFGQDSKRTGLLALLPGEEWFDEDGHSMAYSTLMHLGPQGVLHRCTLPVAIGDVATVLDDGHRGALVHCRVDRGWQLCRAPWPKTASVPLAGVLIRQLMLWQLPRQPKDPQAVADWKRSVTVPTAPNW